MEKGGIEDGKKERSAQRTCAKVRELHPQICLASTYW